MQATLSLTGSVVVDYWRELGRTPRPDRLKIRRGMLALPGGRAVSAGSWAQRQEKAAL